MDRKLDTWGGESKTRLGFISVDEKAKDVADTGRDSIKLDTYDGFEAAPKETSAAVAHHNASAHRSDD